MFPAACGSPKSCPRVSLLSVPWPVNPGLRPCPEKSWWIWWKVFEGRFIEVGVALTTYALRDEPNVPCCLWECPVSSMSFLLSAAPLPVNPGLRPCPEKSWWIWWKVFEGRFIEVGVALMTYALRDEPNVTCCLWECPVVSTPVSSTACEPWTSTLSWKELMNLVKSVWG